MQVPKQAYFDDNISDFVEIDPLSDHSGFNRLFVSCGSLF